jgi:hypothetical protein
VDPGDEQRKPWLCISMCVALMACLIAGIVVLVKFTTDTPSSRAVALPLPGSTVAFHQIDTCGELMKQLAEPVTELSQVEAGRKLSEWFQSEPPVDSSQSMSECGNGFKEVQFLPSWSSQENEKMAACEHDVFCIEGALKLSLCVACCAFELASAIC